MTLRLAFMGLVGIVLRDLIIKVTSSWYVVLSSASTKPLAAPTTY